MSDGVWRIKIFINGTISPTGTTLTFNITGIIFAVATVVQEFGFAQVWTTQSPPLLGAIAGSAFALPNSNQLKAVLASSQTNWIVQGDFELTGKPTWVP
jgi:hypothetical protein